MSTAQFVTDGPLLLALPVAAAAGLVSFLSPCVLPLVPGYLSYVAGLTGRELEEGATPPAVPAVPTAAVPSGSGGTATLVRPASSQPRAHTPVRGRVVAGAALFVLGFTVVFVGYGALFGSVGSTLRVHQRGIEQVLGAITIVLGLAFAGAFARLPLANREWRMRRLPARGLVGAPVLGVLFGIGWTPCIGPTLVAVQGLALNSATAGRGATLSAAYCVGLGLPFLLVAVAVRRGLGALAAVRRHTRLVTVLGGLLLVVVGLLELTGTWNDLILHLRGVLPGFGETPL
ncbi:MAG TPA: cytochrome c biogenesis CcdA family protein [Frankiaceae bacterium]|nr:cytochrome c biogenesis CcdA family protein [Frankiaceae bacterium]